MPEISQADKTILFLLFGGGTTERVVFGTPGSGIVRPEHYSLTRISRGTVVQTVGSAFLDDFGEGPGQLVIAGSTGWGVGLEEPGIRKLKALEALFVEYEARRVRLRDRNQDPNVVKLWMTDDLNQESLSLYPLEFSLDRSKSRPLLYFYRMRFVIIEDLSANTPPQPQNVLAATLSGVGSALTTLAKSFAAA